MMPSVYAISLNGLRFLLIRFNINNWKCSIYKLIQKQLNYFKENFKEILSYFYTITLMIYIKFKLINIFINNVYILNTR